MVSDIIIAVMGCSAGVLVAHLESRRAPMDEHVRTQLEGLRERMVELEQKYLAYPPAREMVETQVHLQSLYSDVSRRMDRLECSPPSSDVGDSESQE